MRLLHFSLAMALAVLTFYLLIVGQGVLVPFVIALVFWFLINLLTQSYQHMQVGGRPLPYWLCFILSVITFLAIIWLIVQLISVNIDGLVQVAPAYQINLEARLETFLTYFNIDETPSFEQLPEIINLRDIITTMASSLTGFAANSAIVLIYLIFLFFEQGSVDKKVAALIRSPEKEANVRRLMKKINADVRKYISIKMLTSSMIGLLSYIVLIFVGVDFAGFWALLIFLLNFIPTVGSIIATIFPALIALVQFDTLTPFFVVAGVITVLQMLIGNILEPRLMGNSLNLSPVIILLNLSLWGLIWGIPGLFLSVPILVIGMIVLSHLPHTRAIAIVLSKDGNISRFPDEDVAKSSTSPDNLEAQSPH